MHFFFKGNLDKENTDFSQGKTHQAASEKLTKHRRHERWRRVVSVLASVMVFVTTYAMILPAITATRVDLPDDFPVAEQAEQVNFTVNQPRIGDIVAIQDAYFAALAAASLAEATAVETEVAAEPSGASADGVALVEAGAVKEAHDAVAEASADETAPAEETEAAAKTIMETPLADTIAMADAAQHYGLVVRADDVDETGEAATLTVAVLDKDGQAQYIDIQATDENLTVLREAAQVEEEELPALETEVQALLDTIELENHLDEDQAVILRAQTAHTLAVLAGAITDEESEDADAPAADGEGMDADTEIIAAEDSAEDRASAEAESDTAAAVTEEDATTAADADAAADWAESHEADADATPEEVDEVENNASAAGETNPEDEALTIADDTADLDADASAIAEDKPGLSAGDADKQPAEALTLKLAKKAGGVTVTAEFARGVFPAGVQMLVRPVDGEAYEAAVADATGKEGQTLLPLDIQFVCGGREVEPAGDVQVTFQAEFLGAEAEPEVVHIADDGSAKRLEASLTGDQLTLTTDSFSVYVISYTVEFAYDGLEYVLTGGSSITLTALFEALGIRESVEDVKSVEFSDPELVSVSYTAGLLGVGKEWILESLQAFDTEETLTITMKNGNVIAVKVTDAQDIGSFINNINFYKIGDDGTARKTTEFNDGDNAKVQIDFSIGSGAIDSSDRTMVYQLPVNIQIASPIDTVARNSNGERVGTFKVTTSGQIELVFDDSYDMTKAFDGELVFNAVVKNTNNGNSQQVKFTDTIGITIKGEEKPKNSDLSITKNGTLDKDNKKIDYSVVISSRKGSDGNITLTDWPSSNGIAGLDYDLANGQTVTLTKTNEYGQTSTVTATVIKDASGLRIENIPALGENESYTFNYSSHYDGLSDNNTTGYASVSNSARAEDNSNGQTAGWSNQVSSSLISKSASIESGKIKWTIYVGREGEDISGYVLKDTMTADGVTVTPPAKITVNGQEVDFNGSYTFPSGSKGMATVTYYSEYNEADPENFHNEATVTVDGRDYTGSSDYKPGQTTPNQPTYGVTKWSPSTYVNDNPEYVVMKEDGTAELLWTACIDMPLYEKDLTQITYTDKMTSSDHFSALSGDHYTTAKLLKESLVVFYGSESKELVRGEDYDVYDSDGRVVDKNSDDTSIMTGFTIRFLKVDKFANETAVSLNYKSIAVLGMNVGETWTFTNRGKIPSASSTVDYSYTRKGKIDKQASADDKDGNKRSDAANSYGSGLTEIDYQQGIVYYRLVLDTENLASPNNHYTTDIVIKDVLPEGLEYIDGTLDAYYRGDAGDHEYNVYDIPRKKMNNDDANQTLEKDGGNLHESYDSNTRTLSVTIDTASKNSRYIELYYQARINDPDYWNDDTHTKKIYTNTASWDEVRDSESIIVTHDEDKIQKVSSVVNANPKDDGSKTTATYTLTINPQGLDLIDHTDTITVTDVMSLSSDTTVAEFIPTSVKVYQYDKNASDKKGAQLSATRYKFTYDSQKETLELTLPDALAMVVEYQYEFPIIDSINATNVENTARIAGVSGGSTTDKETFSAQDGSATAKRREINLYKVDENDYAKGLSGAKFKIEQYVKTASWGNNGNEPDGHWTDISSKESDGLFSVDENGHLYINGSGAETNMPYDTLYRITEAQAPTNYVQSDKAYYFIWKSDKTVQDVNEFEKATGIAYGETRDGQDPQNVLAIKDQIDYAPDSLTYYIPNEYRHIDIQKVWTDNAGNELSTSDSSIPDSATFTLYRQAKELDSHTVTVKFLQMNEDNNWINNQNSQTIAVANGSPLTITVDHGSFNGYHIVDSNGMDDTIGENSWGAKGNSNYRPVVIEYESITSDLTVEIRHGNEFWTPELSGYTAPYEYNVVPGTKSVVKDDISLNAANKYKATIDSNLDKTYTKDGKTYYYYYWVEEKSVPSGWTASYSVDSNSGVKVGDSITVTNRKDKEEPNTTNISLKKVWSSNNHGGNTQVQYYLYRTTEEPEYVNVTLQYPVEVDNDSGHTDKTEVREKKYKVLKGSNLELFVTHAWWDPYTDTNHLYDIIVNGSEVIPSSDHTNRREITVYNWVKYEENIYTFDDVTQDTVIKLDYEHLDASEFMEPVLEERPHTGLQRVEEEHGDYKNYNGEYYGLIKGGSNNTWTASISGLPKYDESGNKYYYFIYEQDLDRDDSTDLTRFDTTYEPQHIDATSSGNHEVTITNTIRPEYTWLQVQKVWENIPADQRTEDVSVVLYRREKGAADTVEPHWYDQIDITQNGLRETIDGTKYDTNAVGTWAGGWYALDPNYDYFIAETNIDGEWYSNANFFIHYTDVNGNVIEPKIFGNNHYFQVQTGAAGANHAHATITNSSTDVKVTKLWTGDIDGKYIIDGEEYSISDLIVDVQLEQYINDSTTPAEEMKASDKYNASQVMTMDGKADTATDTANIGHNIYNKYYEDSNWHFVWKGLPAIGVNGTAREDYTYKVKEVGIYTKGDTSKSKNLLDKFTVTYGENANGLRITNNFSTTVEKTDVTVNKTWLNKDGSTDWPTGEEVEMTLYRVEIVDSGEKKLVEVEGSDITNPVMLTAEEGEQSYTWTDLPKTLSDGTTEIKYVVKETAVTGYTSYAATANGSEKSDEATALPVPGGDEESGLTASFLNRENEGGKVNIQITKNITDAAGNPINLVADVVNKFSVLTSTTDTDPDHVIDINKNGYTSAYEYLDSYTTNVSDTKITVSSETTGEGEDAVTTSEGSVYVNDLQPGMYTIVEDKNSIPDKVYDKAGNVYEYQNTVIMTEYAWRESGDEGARHVSDSYDKSSDKLIANPEVAGAYGDGLYNGYLDFFVTNVYKKVEGTVDTETLDLELDKAWKNGDKVTPPESGSVTFELNQVATTVTTTTSGDGNTGAETGGTLATIKLINRYDTKSTPYLNTSKYSDGSDIHVGDDVVIQVDDYFDNFDSSSSTGISNGSASNGRLVFTVTEANANIMLQVRNSSGRSYTVTKDSGVYRATFSDVDKVVNFEKGKPLSITFTVTSDSGTNLTYDKGYSWSGNSSHIGSYGKGSHTVVVGTDATEDFAVTFSNPTGVDLTSVSISGGVQGGTSSNTTRTVKENPDGSGFPKTITLTASDKDGDLWKHVEEGLLSKVTSTSGDTTTTTTYTYYLVEKSRSGLASAYTDFSVTGKGTKANPIGGSDGTNNKVTVNATNTVPNPNDKFITVKKTWLDEDGNELLNHPDEVKVDVWRVKLPTGLGTAGGVSFSSKGDVYAVLGDKSKWQDNNNHVEDAVIFNEGSTYYYIRANNQSLLSYSQLEDFVNKVKSGEKVAGDFVTMLRPSPIYTPDQLKNVDIPRGSLCYMAESFTKDGKTYPAGYYVALDTGDKYGNTLHSNGGPQVDGVTGTWEYVAEGLIVSNVNIKLPDNKLLKDEETIRTTYLQELYKAVDDALSKTGTGITWSDTDKKLVPYIDESGDQVTLSITGDDEWQTSFTAPSGYLYFFFERPLPGYTTLYRNQEHGVFDQEIDVEIVNQTPAGQLDITKEWTGDKVTADQVLVKIFRDGVDITDDIAADVASYGLTDEQFYLRNGHKFLIVNKAGNAWETVSVKDLPIAEYSKDAVAYQYSVQEVGYRDTAEGHAGYFWSASDVLTGYSTMVYTRTESTDGDGKKTVTYTAGTSTDSDESASEGVTVGSVTVTPATNAGEDPTITFTSGRSLVTVRNSSDSKTNFQFSKLWKDLSQDTVTTWQKAIEITLYKGSNTLVANASLSAESGTIGDYNWTRTANSDGSFTFTIEGLPAKESGQPITYYVKETKVAGYSDPIYGRKQDSEIVSKTGSDTDRALDGQYIINTPEGGFALPSTGGPGTKAYAVAGACLLAGAGGILTARRRRKPEH